jgi:ribosomal protein L16 Arg81 hydroxylase
MTDLLVICLHYPSSGKSKDSLELSELSEPLLDVVMQPGQILYVPAGFPHTTGKISSSVVTIIRSHP